MKQLSLLLLLLIFSCKDIRVKKESSQDLLEQELKTINWEDVETYPSFSSCDEYVSPEGKKDCFQKRLAKHIIEGFKKDTIIVSQDIQDTIFIKFQISNTGELSLLNLTADSLIKTEIPNLRERLLSNLESLPEIFPAITRNQPVKTEFTLPIVIEMN